MISDKNVQKYMNKNVKCCEMKKEDGCDSVPFFLSFTQGQQIGFLMFEFGKQSFKHIIQC